MRCPPSILAVTLMLAACERQPAKTPTPIANTAPTPTPAALAVAAPSAPVPAAAATDPVIELALAQLSELGSAEAIGMIDPTSAFKHVDLTTTPPTVRDVCDGEGTSIVSKERNEMPLQLDASNVDCKRVAPKRVLCSTAYAGEPDLIATFEYADHGLDNGAMVGFAKQRLRGTEAERAKQLADRDAALARLGKKPCTDPDDPREAGDH